MHHASRFWPAGLAHARHRSVRLDRFASTRCATHWGLICLVGGASGPMAPRLRGRTGSGPARRCGTARPAGNSSAAECGSARHVRSRERRSRSGARGWSRNSARANGCAGGIAARTLCISQATECSLRCSGSFSWVDLVPVRLVPRLGGGHEFQHPLNSMGHKNRQIHSVEEITGDPA